MFNFLPTLEHLSLLGGGLIFLAALAESLVFTGLIIPGLILVILAGFLSAKGLIDLGDLIWLVAAGLILGDLLSFYFARRTGRLLFRKRLLERGYLEAGEEFFKKRGAASLFLGKFIGRIRPVIAFVAGATRLGFEQFIFWEALGAITWAVGYSILGYLLGQAWLGLEAWSDRVSIFILVLVAVVALIYLLEWLIINQGRQFFALIKSLLKSIGTAIVSNPDVRRIASRYPKTSRFLKRRLEIKRFFGLPLTILVIAFLYALFSFLGIIRQVITSADIITVDMQIANLFYAFRYPALVKFFLWVTVLGQAQAILVGVVIFSLILWLWPKRSYLMPLWLTVIGAALTNLLGKDLIHRPRPEVAAYLESSFSFPSGHATLAVAFYGFIIYFLIRQTKIWQRKVNLLFIGLVVILAIGLSRLYLGVHFFSDVIGGYLLGSLWLILGINLAEWLTAKTGERRPSASATFRVKIGFLILVLAWLGAYLILAIRYRPPLLAPMDQGEITETVSNVLDIFSGKNSLSRYTETLIGDRQEPLSFIVITKDDDSLIKDFNKAGWYLANNPNLATLSELAKSAVLKKSYPEAPMTPSFWNHQVNDFGFEKPTLANNVRERHHARVWKTNFELADGERIYVGTASLDRGLNKKLPLVHEIDPDIDSEREVMFNDLKKVEVVAKFSKEPFVGHILGKNFAGDAFFTYGDVYLIYLK